MAPASDNVHQDASCSSHCLIVVTLSLLARLSDGMLRGAAEVGLQRLYVHTCLAMDDG